ncbi:hypothetical protein [Mucilaginibacter antarcticus]|uniref:Uncharacterized protein n=1 Tax=Mucilaginibacter antarcticus TaxID=1855725 RepID=A0ABW5XST4_9SPHI
MKEIANLSDGDLKQFYAVIDALFRDAKAKNSKAQLRGWACALGINNY